MIKHQRLSRKQPEQMAAADKKMFHFKDCLEVSRVNIMNERRNKPTAGCKEKSRLS